MEIVQSGPSPLSRRIKNFDRPAAWSRSSKKASKRLAVRIDDYSRTVNSLPADKRAGYRKPGSNTK